MDVKEFLDYCAGFYKITDSSKRIAELSGLFDLDPGRKIADLSMGNRKKVSIIQGLLHSPKLLIADEPTTGLDPLMQSVFFDLIRSENRKGMTVLYSSHILSEVQMLCKRVAIIKEGKIIRIENIDELRKKQLKKVMIEFPEKPGKDTLKIPGIVNLVHGPENILTFMYSGNMNDLLEFLAAKSIINLVIEEPSLEEIFMHYYKQ